MDNPSFTKDLADDPHRKNSGDYQTLNIGGDDAEAPPPEKPEVTFKETKPDERVRQRPPTGRKAREIPLKPYAGMNKEDLLRFSNTPFWNRLRMACLVFFWLCWLGLLAAVIALTIVLPRCTAPPVVEKWQSSVYYQIYVRSFSDSDGDGVGDINGIISNLDYLEENQVDGIILSSIYKGHTTDPDFGYDVTNHTGVSSEYGTLEDFKRLLQEAHERDIEVLMDFIPGQTGTEHPWFVSSSQAIDDRYRNYYIWSNCTTSNWVSLYNESAWRSTTGGRSECYLGQFLEDQPQLNLRSAYVRQELEKILRYWLDLGVDGFKVTHSPYLFVDYELRNESLISGCSDPNRYECLDHVHTKNQDETYNVIASWRHLLNDYSTKTQRARVLITDANDNINNTVKFYGLYGARAANFPMNYLLRNTESGCNGECLEENINQWLQSVPPGQTSNWATSNQDISRNASSLGVNVLNLLTLTLPGGALFYYGDELGLLDGPRPVPSQDPVGRININWSRDPFRTPMPWTNDTSGGFVNQSAGNGPPWLPIYTNVQEINVLAQESQRRSPLNNFRRLAFLRQSQGALQFGSFRFGVVNSDIISFIREYDGYDNLLVVANVGQSEVTVDLSAAEGVPRGSATLLFASDPTWDMAEDESVDLRNFPLKPGQGALISWPFARPTS